ncbi:hypothetical protein [Mycobacterium sp. MMS18-G62]
MKTTSTRAKMISALGAAAVAIAAPAAVLFASVGTAHADDVCTTPYNEGYLDGSFGGVGKCYLDPSKQSSYDSGFADGSAGRPSNPPAPWPTIRPNPGEIPQTSMSPWDGTTGSGMPEPPEFPEYHEPLEPYTPAEQPWAEIEPPVIP